MWVKEYKEKHNINPSNELKKETLEEENKRLRKELALVKQEREILKKAAHTSPKKLYKVCMD